MAEKTGIQNSDLPLASTAVDPPVRRAMADAAPDSQPVELSVVMPCLDESATLESCIRAAQSFFTRAGVRGEVIVGDNGSTDGSADIARRCGARVAAVAERGYGAAIYHAVQQARGTYVVMGDADASYDFASLDDFLAKLREGNELVMGNRFLGGIKPGAMPWKNRYIGNPALSGIGRLFFGVRAGDFHCGLRGFSRAAFQRMDLHTTGMEFASEMAVKATLLGMRTAEVPVTLSPDGRSRPPHLRPWRDGWRHLRFMLLCSPRWLFLYPGLFLMLAGLGAGAWLLPGPRKMGGVVLDVHTLLYCGAAVLIGAQSVAFAVLSKVFAIRENVLPEDPRLARVLRHANLERGIALGGILAACGIAGALGSVLYWRQQSFGPLDPSVTLRLVIPSVVALMLGLQIILASFFLSVLQLGLRRH